jgi:hypothetical protein
VGTPFTSLKVRLSVEIIFSISSSKLIRFSHALLRNNYSKYIDALSYMLSTCTCTVHGRHVVVGVNSRGNKVVTPDYFHQFFNTPLLNGIEYHVNVQWNEGWYHMIVTTMTILYSTSTRLYNSSFVNTACSRVESGQVLPDRMLSDTYKYNHRSYSFHNDWIPVEFSLAWFHCNSNMPLCLHRRSS